MAEVKLNFTADTSNFEMKLAIVLKHLNALADELRQLHEYPHGVTDDRGRPIRPDGSVIEPHVRCSTCKRVTGMPSAPCRFCLDFRSA